MAAINFPENPVLNQEFSSNGRNYKYDGTKWIIINVITTESIGAAPLVHTHDFTDINNTPTTLSGYGITDTYTKTETDTNISNAVNAIIDVAPEALNTLNELAAALGNDANFATTITTTINGKADLNHTHSTSDITSGEFDVARLGSGTATIDYVLTSDGDGTASWQEVLSGSSVTISDTVPINPEQGDLWWDSIEGAMYIFYNDGTSSQWVEASSSGVVSVFSVNGQTGEIILDAGDVGLDNVENYAIASQAEAESGTSNEKYMTPLRTSQAIIDGGTF
jgi:hypothetical protein